MAKAKPKVVTILMGLLVWVMTVQPSFAVELKLGTATASGSVTYKCLLKTKENVEKETSGEITIKLFPDSQVGSDPEMLAQLKKGTLDLYEVDLGAAVMLPGGMPFMITWCPYLFRDQEHMAKFAVSPIGQEMIKEVEEKNGIKWLGLTWPRTPRALTIRQKAVSKPADLKGIKLRVPPAPPILETFKVWGASVITLPMAELYSGLKQKIVDGQENGLDFVLDFHLYEVQKYFTAIDYSQSAVGLWMNRQKWDSLSKTHQQDLLSALSKTYKWSKEYMLKVTEDGYSLLQRKGVTVILPPLKPWQESSRKVVEMMEKKGLPSGLYQKIQNIQ